MATLKELITTKQQDAGNEFESVFVGNFELDYLRPVKPEELRIFVKALVFSTAQSVLDAVKELVPPSGESITVEGMRMNSSGVGGWNACRAELLSRLERFSSNEE